MILDEINQLSNGAQFRRADLHIHSYRRDEMEDERRQISLTSQ